MKNLSIALLGFMALAISGKALSQKLYIFDQNTNQPIKGAEVKPCEGSSKTLNQTGMDGYVTMKEYLDCYFITAEGYASKTLSSDEIKDHRLPIERKAEA